MTVIKCDRCTKDINESDALVMVAIVNVPFKMTKAYNDYEGILRYKEIKKTYGEIDLCPDCSGDFDKFMKEKK